MYQFLTLVILRLTNRTTDYLTPTRGAAAGETKEDERVEADNI